MHAREFLRQIRLMHINEEYTPEKRLDLIEEVLVELLEKKDAS